MYSRCLFCHGNLGSNESIEKLPVGRRLAFDEAKGRLWVICPSCERWNLTAIEERWEAIEDCERRYRATKLRVATDHIGLARLADGTELVRIGRPLLPELAAWRYGDQFGRRRKRVIVQGVAGLALFAAVVPLSAVVALPVAASVGFLPQLGALVLTQYLERRVATRLTLPDGERLVVQKYQLPRVSLVAATRDRPWGILIDISPVDDRRLTWGSFDPESNYKEIHGDAAIPIAASLLPLINKPGASKRKISEAVSLLERYENPQALFKRAASLADKSNRDDFKKRWKLATLEPELRLALEMSSHEDAERRALEGELALLEQAWKDAEEIAAISDDLLVPQDVTRRLGEMKSRRPRV
jgi:hypothetical protein